MADFSQIAKIPLRRMHILVPTEIKPKGFYYGMHNYSLVIKTR
jgi:hypothetical protein